jgi:hypothetical protein
MSPAASAFIQLLRRRQQDDPTQRGDVYAI